MKDERSHASTTTSDEFSYWNANSSMNKNETVYADSDRHFNTLGGNGLLLRRKSNGSTHVVTTCACQRAFHLFCTDLFPQDDHRDTDMIHLHPAPRQHSRGARRSMPVRNAQVWREGSEHETFSTANPDANQSHRNSIEKKLPNSSKPTTRPTPSHPSSTSSTAISSFIHRSLSRKASNPPPSMHASAGPESFASLRIRARPLFDPSSSSESIVPRDPPPSPTEDFAPIRSDSKATIPIRVISIVPRARQSNEADNPLPATISTKNTTYDDHALQYLSDSDGSSRDNDRHHPSATNVNRTSGLSKPKFSLRTPSLARPTTGSRNRSLPNRNSPCDARENGSHPSRRSLPLKTSVILPVYDADGLAPARNRTKAGTAVPRAASAFGFSKTASSMHFGHAADRLNLHASFDRWPRTLFRRTPLERKQEVTTLRLVTLPLVTS